MAQLILKALDCEGGDDSTGADSCRLSSNSHYENGYQYLRLKLTDGSWDRRDRHRPRGQYRERSRTPQ